MATTMEITTESDPENPRFSMASQARDSDQHKELEQYRSTTTGRIVTGKYVRLWARGVALCGLVVRSPFRSAPRFLPGSLVQPWWSR